MQLADGYTVAVDLVPLFVAGCGRTDGQQDGVIVRMCLFFHNTALGIKNIFDQRHRLDECDLAAE